MTGIIAVPGVVSGRDATLIKAVVGGMMPEVTRLLSEATAPLLARIAALEARELQLPEKGDPGEQGPQGEPGRDGEVDMAAVREIVAAATKEQVAALAANLPLPEKGDPGERGEKGEPGEVDMDAVKALIDAAVASLPAAERGEKGERGEDGLPGEKGADGAPGEPGKDGAGIADALIDNAGHLVLTMTDGRIKNLGSVHGKDGERGQDGADGLGFEHMDIEQVNDRTLCFMFKREDQKAEVSVTFPLPIYRGVFKEGREYEQADLVTWGGSLWHCNEPKGLKPGAPDSGWQLAAKAGRPGKDAGK